LTQNDLLSFLDSLEVTKPLAENEITVDQFAERRGIPRDAARKTLVAQIKAGVMVRRPASANGKFTWAYSLKKD
jgi:prolyl-tRNA editing enzyme YbaK/EbsC (Cys-tRNA(Pro) deacylase)